MGSQCSTCRTLTVLKLVGVILVDRRRSLLASLWSWSLPLLPACSLCILSAIIWSSHCHIFLHLQQRNSAASFQPQLTESSLNNEPKSFFCVLSYFCWIFDNSDYIGYFFHCSDKITNKKEEYLSFISRCCDISPLAQSQFFSVRE